MRGRKPKPTHLKLIEGNPGRRPIKPNEPQPDPTIPVECPAYLPPAAKVEWHRLAPELRRTGVLTSVDIGVFASYCMAFARWRLAEETLERMELADPLLRGLIARTSKGGIVLNPVLSVANQAMRDMLRFGSELGLTPAARVRLATDGAPASGQDPLARLMRMTQGA